MLFRYKGRKRWTCCSFHAGALSGAVILVFQQHAHARKHFKLEYENNNLKNGEYTNEKNASLLFEEMFQHMYGPSYLVLFVLSSTFLLSLHLSGPQVPNMSY